MNLITDWLCIVQSHINIPFIDYIERPDIKINKKVSVWLCQLVNFDSCLFISDYNNTKQLCYKKL